VASFSTSSWCYNSDDSTDSISQILLTEMTSRVMIRSHSQWVMTWLLHYHYVHWCNKTRSTTFNKTISTQQSHLQLFNHKTLPSSSPEILSPIPTMNPNIHHKHLDLSACIRFYTESIISGTLHTKYCVSTWHVCTIYGVNTFMA